MRDVIRESTGPVTAYANFVPSIYFAVPVVIPKLSVPGTAATMKEKRRRQRAEAVIAEFDPK